MRLLERLADRFWWFRVRTLTKLIVRFGTVRQIQNMADAYRARGSVEAIEVADFLESGLGSGSIERWVIERNG